jgi:hypothetical protein
MLTVIPTVVDTVTSATKNEGINRDCLFETHFQVSRLFSFLKAKILIFFEGLVLV